MEKTTVKNESADKDMSEAKNSDVNMSDDFRISLLRSLCFCTFSSVISVPYP